MKITQKPSPNYTPGRTHKIDRIVCHWIVGNLASADATFANPKSGVSAHYAIETNSVHQYVKESDTAWHAGNGAMNSRSIGIEHSAAPNRPASASTIETSAQLLAQISKRYNLPLNRTTVIKHSEVTPTQCPGTIPIDSIIKRANELLKGETMAVIENKSNWRNRFDRLHRQLVRNGGMSDNVFKGIVGKDAWSVVEDWSDHPEANQLIQWSVLGQRASQGKWEQQLKNLAEQNEAHINRIKELEAELAVQSDDTKNLNAFGVSLRWLISRLGIK